MYDLLFQMYVKYVSTLLLCSLSSPNVNLQTFGIFIYGKNTIYVILLFIHIILIIVNNLF